MPAQSRSPSALISTSDLEQPGLQRSLQLVSGLPRCQLPHLFPQATIARSQVTILLKSEAKENLFSLKKFLKIILCIFKKPWPRWVFLAERGPLYCAFRLLRLQSAGSRPSRSAVGSVWPWQPLGNWILLIIPPSEIEPTSPVLEGGFLTTGLPGKSQKTSLFS